VLTACHTVGATVAAGYHAAEPRWRAADRRRAEFVRSLLWGTLPAAEITRHAPAHGIDRGRDYVALRARPTPGRTMDELAGAHGFTFGRTNGGGLGAVGGGDLVGFVAAAPKPRVPGVSGFGPPRPLDRLDESFRMASRALETADRHGMTGVHEFSGLGLLPAVLADGAVGDALRRRYLDPLGDTEFAVEMVDTLRAYLFEEMNVARTAERMCVHPNTVRYRIGRFEELTGVNLRRNPTASFEVLWALEQCVPNGCVHNGSSSKDQFGKDQSGGTIATTRAHPASAPASLTGRQLTAKPCERPIASKSVSRSS
jgi:hypothetical protein